MAMRKVKLVVGDLATAEPCYRALGKRVVHRHECGTGEVARRHCWLAPDGDDLFILILARLTGGPPPPRPAYPGEVWLPFDVDEVDAIAARALAAGGTIVRAGEDQPEHGMRAAILADPERHLIEVVGPPAGG